MMRTLIVACIGAGLAFGSSGWAQSDNHQAIPDAPLPQKKPAPKPPPAADASSTYSSSTDSSSTDSSSTKDDNAFPEAVSRDAAKQAAAPATGAATPDSPKKPTANDNPFPEAVSRQAAKDAEKAPEQPAEAPPRSDLPPGVSSSQSSSQSAGDLGTPDEESGAAPQQMDPVRARKDADVGGFYLKAGDYKGALLRYKDATASDPTNVDAIFGLAETQRMLKNNAEAARNYQLYLEIVPNGPKARQALKALKELHSGNQSSGH